MGHRPLDSTAVVGKQGQPDILPDHPSSSDTKRGRRFQLGCWRGGPIAEGIASLARAGRHTIGTTPLRATLTSWNKGLRNGAGVGKVIPCTLLPLLVLWRFVTARSKPTMTLTQFPAGVAAALPSYVSVVSVFLVGLVIGIFIMFTACTMRGWSPVGIRRRTMRSRAVANTCNAGSPRTYAASPKKPQRICGRARFPKTPRCDEPEVMNYSVPKLLANAYLSQSTKQVRVPEVYAMWSPGTFCEVDNTSMSERELIALAG